MTDEHKEILHPAAHEQPTEQTSPPRTKVSLCTNISILLALLSPITFFLLYYLDPFNGQEKVAKAIAAIFITFLYLLITAIVGIMGIISILTSKGKRSGLKRNILALLLTSFGLWIGGICLLVFCHAMTRAHSTSRMMSLGNALAMYERDFGCMPKENWCDILIQDEDVNKAQFRSYAAKSGECHYAFNKNLVGYENELPEDVVVLFESKYDGWNQIGGVELMATTEYLPKGSWLYWKLVKAMDEKHLDRGCYVCFGDGHVEFVKPEEYHNLRWHVP